MLVGLFVVVSDDEDVKEQMVVLSLVGSFSCYLANLGSNELWSCDRCSGYHIPSMLMTGNTAGT